MNKQNHLQKKAFLINGSRLAQGWVPVSINTVLLGHSYTQLCIVCLLCCFHKTLIVAAWTWWSTDPGEVIVWSLRQNFLASGLKYTGEPCVMGYACDPSIWEAEAGSSRVWRAAWAAWDLVSGMPKLYLLPEVILLDNVKRTLCCCFETELHSVALVSLVFTVQPKLASNSWQLSCLIFMGTEITGVNHHIWLPDVELWGSVLISIVSKSSREKILLHLKILYVWFCWKLYLKEMLRILHSD